MNGYPNPFPYGMGYNQYMQGFMGQQPQSVHVDQVDGEQGARELSMPPNSEKLALDTSGKIVWLIKTDNYGMKSLVAPYDIEPHKTQQATQFDSIDERLKRLEGILSEFIDSADSSTVKRDGKQKSDTDPIYAT